VDRHVAVAEQDRVADPRRTHQALPSQIEDQRRTNARVFAVAACNGCHLGHRGAAEKQQCRDNKGSSFEPQETVA
jgi:hypothetical protein